jgi:hypothetical protein
MAAADYDSALFLDNDLTYIEQLKWCPKITSIHVGGIQGSPPEVNIVNGPEYEEFRAGLSDEGREAMKFFCINFNNRDLYDVSSGIKEEHIEQALNWAEGDGKKAILIDFDRTLSVIEGFSSDHYPNTFTFKQRYPQPEITAEGYINYLVGGTVRLYKLRAMLTLLYAQGIDIFILTNNPGCMNSPVYFNDLVSVITEGRPVNYICGLRFGGNKYYAVVNTPGFASLCAFEGGRRRNKRKTHRQKQKKTRLLSNRRKTKRRS